MTQLHKFVYLSCILLKKKKHKRPVNPYIDTICPTVHGRGIFHVYHCLYVSDTAETADQSYLALRQRYRVRYKKVFDKIH